MANEETQKPIEPPTPKKSKAPPPVAPSMALSKVLVTNVDPEGVAYISGIRKGDIIYSLARIKIKNVNEFKDVLSDLDIERRTTIGVARNGNKRILSINLSE